MHRMSTCLRKGYEKNLQVNVAHIPKGQRFSQYLDGLDPFQPL